MEKSVNLYEHELKDGQLVPLKSGVVLECLTLRLNEAGYVLREKPTADERQVICVACNGAVEVAYADVRDGVVEIEVPNEEQVDAAKFIRDFLDEYIS